MLVVRHVAFAILVRHVEYEMVPFGKQSKRYIRIRARSVVRWILKSEDVGSVAAVRAGCVEALRSDGRRIGNIKGPAMGREQFGKQITTRSRKSRQWHGGEKAKKA